MKKLNDIDKEIRNKSIKYLGITLLFIMLPYMVKLFVYYFYDGIEIDLIEEFTNGSFIMYAISLLAPIWYTVETMFDAGTQKGRGIPFTKTFITLCILSILYGLLFFGSCTGYFVKEIPTIILSITLMIWSVYLAFVIHKNDLSINQPDQQRKYDEECIKANMQKVENGEKIENKINGIEGNLDFLDFEEEDE